MERKNYNRSDSKLIGYLLLTLSFFVIPILLFIYSGINAFNESKSLPEPQHTTLAGSLSLLDDKKQAWVIIDDLVWDCNHISQETQRVSKSKGPDRFYAIIHIPFTNKQHDIFGEKRLRLPENSTLTCDVVNLQKVVGLLMPTNDLDSHPPVYEDASEYTVNGKSLWLCHNCRGKDAATTDVIISMGMILIFLLPIVFILFRFYTVYVV